MKAVGQRIRAVREAYEAHEPGRHSQSAWAEDLGVSITMYHRIERGIHPVSVQMLQRIIYAARVSPWFLLFGVIDRNPLWERAWLTNQLAKAHQEAMLFPAFAQLRTSLEQIAGEQMGAAHVQIRGRPPRKPGRKPRKTRGSADP